MECDINIIHPHNVTGQFEFIVNGEKKKYRRFVDIPRWVDEVISFKPDYIDPVETRDDELVNENIDYLFFDLMKRVKPAIDYRSKYAGGS